MRLFLYGTLLCPPTLAMRSGDPAVPLRCIAATLHGWRRVALNAVPWPTLRRDAKGAVSGIIANVPAPALAHLTAWEGGMYRLTRVVVATARGKTVAHTWIAPGGSRRPWRGSTHAASAARPTRHARR